MTAKITFEQLLEYFENLDNWDESARKNAIIGHPLSEEEKQHAATDRAEYIKKYDGVLYDKPVGKLSLNFSKVYQTSDGDTHDQA